MTLIITMICCYAECRILFSILLSVIVLSAVMLNVVMLSVVMLSIMAPYKELGQAIPTKLTHGEECT
jgi:hypothetical protein